MTEETPQPLKAPPEPETRFPAVEIIDRAQTALGVAPEVAAGALSGCTECTVTEAKKRVKAWLNQEVG